MFDFGYLNTDRRALIALPSTTLDTLNFPKPWTNTINLQAPAPIIVNIQCLLPVVALALAV